MIRYSRNFLLLRCMSWKSSVAKVQTSRHCSSQVHKGPLDFSTWSSLKSLGILRQTRGCRGGQSRLNSKNSYSIKSCISHRRNNLLNIQDSPISPRSTWPTSPIATTNSLIYIKPNNDHCSDSPSVTLREDAAFCLLNARSIRNKARIIKNFVIDSDIDILAITETWLSGDESDDFHIREICPSGYNILHVPRPVSNGGGVAIVSRNIFNAEMSLHQSYSSFEHTELQLKCNGRIIRLIVVYRPPRLGVSSFLDEFATYLSQLSTSSGYLLLTGDFNLHIDVTDDTLSRRFLDLLHTFNLVQNVSAITHNRGHILDLVITREDEQIVSDFVISDPGLSDHLAVQCKLSLPYKLSAKKLVTSRNLRSINIDEFSADLATSDLLKHYNDLDVSTLVSHYNNTLSSLIDTYAPLKHRWITSRPHSPWFTPDILQAKRKRRRLERKWRSTKCSDDHQLYTDQCCIVNDLVRNAKESYYSSIIDDNKGDQGVLFRSVDKLLNIKPEEQFPSCSSDQRLAQNFNNYFIEKIEAIRTMIDCNPVSLDSTIDSATCEITCFEPMSTEEVSHLVSSKVKSCQLDPVPVPVLKPCLPVLLPVITEIVNRSLSSAIVPNCLKIAQIRPLLKKPSLDFKILKNFRPLSNLPFISKVIEKSVCSQLIDYLSSNNLGETFQSAYKRMHSTETALLRVQDDILRSIDNNRSVALLLLDLSAAFDLVDHDILLHRLQHRFGVKGKALSWFCSYLDNRKQFVSVRGQSSSLSPLNQGVPQGSVLGPILYLLYTSPLGSIIKKHGMLYHLYADDTQLYISFDSSQPCNFTSDKLEACINDVAKWMSANRLKLNSDKTELIVFSSQFRPKVSLQISINNDVIESANSAKNIGVIFDKNLKFDSHVKSICRSSYFHLRNISRIRNYLSVDSTKTLVHAFVTCKLDNCNSLLYGLPKHLISKLQLVQNCAAKLIFKQSKYSHVTPLLKQLHWLPVHYRILFKILLMTYKAFNGLAPAYIKDLLEKYHPNRPLRSSKKNLLKTPVSNTVTYGDRAFSVAAPTLWNVLPDDIKSCANVQNFKKNLKTHLFSKAFN